MELDLWWFKKGKKTNKLAMKKHIRALDRWSGEQQEKAGVRWVGGCYARWLEGGWVVAS